MKILLTTILFFISANLLLVIIINIQDNIDFTINRNEIINNTYLLNKSTFLRFLFKIFILSILFNLFFYFAIYVIKNVKTPEYIEIDRVEYNFYIPNEVEPTPKNLLNRSSDRYDAYYKITLNIDNEPVSLDPINPSDVNIIYNKEITMPYLVIIYLQRDKIDGIYYDTDTKYEIHFPFNYQFKDGGKL